MSSTKQGGFIYRFDSAGSTCAERGGSEHFGDDRDRHRSEGSNGGARSRDAPSGDAPGGDAPGGASGFCAGTCASRGWAAGEGVGFCISKLGRSSMVSPKLQLCNVFV